MTLRELARRSSKSRTPEQATLTELIEMFCDPRKAERAERRWARVAARETKRRDKQQRWHVDLGH